MAKQVIDVKVIFSAIGEAALEKAKGTINGLDDGVKRASRSWKEYTIAAGAVTAAAGASYYALREVYGLLKEGAALQTTIGRFNKLSASIGTTADVMMGRLRDATKGMMSDAELMASASQIMSLGLAKNEDQVVRLATVAGTLNWDMQQVILTFANMSTMRLDALGLSVEDVTSRAKELEAAGMSAADAFKEAVIQAGEARLDVGGVSEAEESIRKLESAAANAGDAFKAAFSEGAVQALGDSATAVTTLSSAITDIAPLVTTVAKTLFDPLVEGALKLQIVMLQVERLKTNGFQLFDPVLVASSAAMSGNVEQLQAGVALLQGSMEAYGTQTAAARTASAEFAISTLYAGDGAISTADKVKALVASQGYLAGATEGSALAMDNAAAAAYTWGDAVARAIGIARGIQYGMSNDVGTMAGMYAVRDGGWDGRQYQKEEEGIKAATRAMGGYSTAINEAEAAANRLKSAFSSEISGNPAEGLIDEAGMVNIERANELLYTQAAAAGASATELAMLGIATGKFSEEQAKAALKAAVLQEAISRMAKSIVSGQTSIDDAVAAVGDIKVSLDSTTDMAGIQAMIAGIEADPTAVNVDFIPLSANVRSEMADIDGTQLTVRVNYQSSGMPGRDSDGDGVPDSEDNYPYDPSRRQLGGPVERGRPYLVGEAGPELFVPGMNGFVVSNNNMQPKPGNMNVTINISGSAADSDRVGDSVRTALNEFWSDLKFEGVSW